MIFQEKKSANAGPSCGTGEGVAHSKRTGTRRVIFAKQPESCL